MPFLLQAQTNVNSDYFGSVEEYDTHNWVINVDPSFAVIKTPKVVSFWWEESASFKYDRTPVVQIYRRFYKKTFFRLSMGFDKKFGRVSGNDVSFNSAYIIDFKTTNVKVALGIQKSKNIFKHLELIYGIDFKWIHRNHITSVNDLESYKNGTYLFEFTSILNGMGVNTFSGLRLTFLKDFYVCFEGELSILRFSEFVKNRTINLNESDKLEFDTLYLGRIVPIASVFIGLKI